MKDSYILEVVQRIKDSPFKDVNTPILTMNEDGMYSYKLLSMDQLKEELIKVQERVNARIRGRPIGSNTITTKYISSSTYLSNVVYNICSSVKVIV